MQRVRHIAAVLAALLIFAAVPTVAAAQSAGENQYTDPLNPGGNSGSGGGNSGGGGSGGGAPQPQAPASPAPASPAQPAGTAQGAGSNKSLPRTGMPVALLALSGGALLAGGLALRRRA
jgi:hypothetical protein